MFFLSINVKNIGIPYGEMNIYIPPVRMNVIEDSKPRKTFKVDNEAGNFRIETSIGGQRAKMLLNLEEGFGYLRLLDQSSSVLIKDQSIEDPACNDTKLLEPLLPFLERFLDIIQKMVAKFKDEAKLAETKIVPAIRKRSIVDDPYGAGSANSGNPLSSF